MATFESLRPREDTLFPEDLEGPDLTAFSPITPAGISLSEQRRTSRLIPRDTVDRPVVSNIDDSPVGDVENPPYVGPGQNPVSEESVGQREDGRNDSLALHRQGVNWADISDVGAANPRLRAARTDFYETDYDPEGKVSRALGRSRDYVEAANVFGKQFSRDELMKDDEGQRLVHLMEVQRSGAHRDEGFWSGFATFKDTSGSLKRALADIPFLGWMVDGGFTVGETIAVSKAMRKMQNGEVVSNHEALAVRRYMLQAELDSERGIGYKAGEVFHSSIPFAIEMATAGYLTAKATAIGASVGGPWGAAIGLIGGLIFGGVGVAWKMFARRGVKGAMKKGVEAAAKQTMASIAKAEFGKDVITRKARATLYKTVREHAGGDAMAKAAIAESREIGQNRVLLKWGRDAAIERLGEAQAKTMPAEALIEMGKSEAKKRSGMAFAKEASFEANKYLASRYSRVVKPDMSARAARVFLVGGDQERSFHYGLMEALETATLAKNGQAQTGEVVLKYGARKKLLRQLSREGKGLTEAEADDVVKKYIEGTLKAGSVSDSKSLGEAAKAVVESMEASLGGDTVNHGYAREVLDYLGKSAQHSFELKYGATTTKQLFVNDMKRFGGFLADGILDGAFRWDQSIFGGIGTIARDGTALHGKMNVLKEAMKVSMIEAPVRGALQMAVGAPLWPAAAAMSGHSPGDFVLKGQLGIQATALRTGDKDLMDNARAIALGAGLVEYMSENAGRGFNMFMSGIVKPSVMNVLPEQTKQLGSALAKKVEAIFGSSAAMKKENFEAIAGKIESRLGAEVSAGKLTGSVSRTEIMRLVETGKASANLETVARQLGMKPKKLVSEAVAEIVTDGKARTAALSMFSYEMMRRGWTPQKMVDVLQKVGYDGMLSEMAEERYGGFLQGLFGLNERPSDEGFRGRLAAAWEGLFPDKEQLAVEAIGFAIPSISHLSLSHLQSRLGQGMLSKIRQASQGLHIIKSSIPDISVSGVSAGYVNAVREHQEKVDEAVRTRFGTEEGNRAKALEGAAAAFAKVRAANEAESRKEAPPPGAPRKTESNQHLFGIDSEKEFSLELGRVMDAIVEQSGTEEELDANIDRYDAKALFGEDGVEAIRNMKRLDGDFVDQAKRDFDASPEMQALYDATPRSEDYAEPMSVEDVINRVEMTVPVRGEDMSPIAGAAGRAGADTAIRANQYGQDVLGETAANLAVLGNASFNLQNNRTTLPENASFKERVVDGGLRVLSRLCSIVDAIVTGDLSLAARNPIQWALADESVDKSLLGTVGMMKQRSFRMGMAQVLSEERNNLAELDEKLADEVRPLLEEIDEAVAKAGAAKNDPAARKAAYDRKNAAERELERRLATYATSIGQMQMDKMGEDMKRRFEAAGEESYQRMLRDYASRFLAARNVLAVSQSDLSDAALSVVADRFARRQGAESLFMYRRDDGSVATTANFLSPEFREAHAEDIERAKHEIIDKLVNLATGDAIKLNTNARFSVTESTAAAIDYQRAMRQGTTPEILAAIKGMPAFAASRVVVDLSLGNATRDALGALGSVADVSELLNMQLDENGDLAPGDLMRVMRLRGRNFVYASPEQNQRDARRFLRQVRVLADNMLPYVCLDAQGNRLDVTYERGVDAKTGAPFARATVWSRDESGRPTASATYAARSMIELVYALKAAGLQAKMRQLVVADSFSLASRDATSMLLYRFGDRDNARAFYLKQGVDDAHMPPLCRRKYDSTTKTEDWEFTEDEAAEQLRQEIELASMPNAPTGREEDYENARGAVYGNEGTEDTPAILGYETVAADYLRSLGMSPVMNTVEENLIVGSGEKWVFAPNSMTRGDSMFITSDYNSSGDSEAMLRATLESAFLNHSVREHHAGRTGFMDTLRAVSREFDEAAAMIISELEPTKPEWAQRIRTLQEALSGPGGDANPRKLAAIAAAALCFTSERGLGERGNGFLFSPELAAVADQLRTSEWFTLLISAADEALGGVGLFSEASDLAGAKVQELIDAFSPTGEAVAQSRKTSIFNRTGEEGAEKPNVPYSVMKYEGATLGKNGMTAHASFELRSFGELQNLNNVRPDTVLFETAEAARVFAERFRKDVGRPMTLDDAVLLTQAAVGAGDAGESVRPEIRRKKEAPAAPAFGGARVVSDASSEAVRPRTDDIISQVAAAKLARGLAFLEPSEEARKKAMAGKLTEIEANKYAEIRSEDVQDEAGEGEVRTTLYDEVDAFLRSRRVDKLSRAVILENLAIGIGEPLESVDGQEQGQDDEDDPDESEAATDEGRLTPFQDKRKAESAVKNKDLQEIGSILQYLFPVQMRNHTALFYHVATEIGDLPAWLQEMAQSEEAPAWMKEALADKELMAALERLGSALNVLRRPGEADPEGRVASSFDWGDAEATDKLLSDAVQALSIVKRDELALAVNMLRLLGRGRRGATRRAKALSDIASMCQLDAEVTRVRMTEDGVSVEASRPGYGEVGAEPVQAAILAEFVSGAPFTANGSLWGGLDAVKNMLIHAEDVPDGARAYDKNTGKEIPLNHDDIELPEFDKVAGTFSVAEETDRNRDIVAIVDWLDSDGFRFADRIPLSIHASVVAFARKFVQGLRDASDTLTGWIDHHTELQTLVRVRGLEGAIVRDVEATLMAAIAKPSSERVASEVYRSLCYKVFYLYRETGGRLMSYKKTRYDRATRTKVQSLEYVKHECPILETLVLNPAWAAASYGYIPMDETDPNAGTQMILSIEDFDEVLDDDLGLVRAAARTNVKSSVSTANNLTRSNAFQETKVLGSFDTSAIASLTRWYADVAPRRTAQVSVRTNAQFQDSGRAVQTPSTAPLAEYRLAASLFGQVKRGDGTWADSYAANGRMFDDGTMATVVTPGVEIGDRLAEGSSVARYVFEANVGSFVEDRDFRNVRFQLYHGEKPTVYSQQLPGEMVDQMWKDIVAGAKYTLNKYTSNQARADRLRTMPASLEELKTKDDRRFAYNMLFAVVASHAGCDQIDPKRTQVLMSQGVMYAGHRDFAVVEGADGELHEERLDSQIGKDGKPVVPMTRFIVSLAEFTSDGAPDLGMYCITGNLVEMQRATATNRDAESFKNHLNAVAGVFLTKGQGHDLKMGLYEDEDVPALGTLLAAQAAMRREAERLLGLEKGILDLPDEAKAKDAGYVARRDAAVAAVEFFLRHSTFVHTDLETQKVGLFAARNGVEVVNGEFTVGEGESAVRFRRDGQSISYEKDGERVKVERLPVGSMKKDGPVPVAVAIAAYMSATGKSEMSDEDCAALKARWVTATGTVDAALGESGLLMKGDVLSFGKDSLGNFQARFGSRHIVGQVMANNDASADMGHHSRAATNYTRDQAANQGARPHKGELTVSRILTVARALPAALFRTEKGLADAYLESDEQFAMRRAENPWDDTVRAQEDRKLNAHRANAMRVYPTATHAVLLGSGIKADIDRATHKVKGYSYAAGVTEYDKDAVRDARILPTRVANAYGVDRTIPSGLVNVVNDPSFRYGWHLNDEAFEKNKAALELLLMAPGTGSEFKLNEYKTTLREAHGEGAMDTEAVALVAAAIWTAHHIGGEKKAAVMKLFGEMFTDYTGRKLSDHLKPEQLEAVSFHDLFLHNDGVGAGNDFDFTAIEFGEKGRKLASRDKGAPRTIYLGGSLFSGDRRPSGNFEAASGMSRAQLPVKFNKKTGVPSDRAQFVLSPVLNAVQGSDTDGDSATLIRFSGRGATKLAHEAVDAVFKYIDGVRLSRAGTLRAGKLSDSEAKGIVEVLRGNPRYERFLREVPVRRNGKQVKDGYGNPVTRTVLSEEFTEALGDLLFEVQVNNYRRTPTVEQGGEDGKPPRSGSELADSDPDIMDIGFSGRDPVGPDAVFDSPVEDGAALALYRDVMGDNAPAPSNYSKAFKACIDKLTEGRVPSFDILDAEVAAYLSGEAADASDARATAVSLQASIEHVAAYSRDDERMQSLYPHLYAPSADGYSPLKELVAHLDGISNALFDVVKDLFAPRAGWRDSMLNYLVAKLLSDAEAGLKSGNVKRLDDAWFFKELVGYARDFHSSELSIPGLLRRASADNNFLDEDGFGATSPEKTLRGCMKAAMAPGEGRDTVLSWLARNVVVPSKKEGARVPFSSVAGEDVFESGDLDFVDAAKGWVDRMLGAAKTMDNVFRLANSLKTAPESLRRAVLGGGGTTDTEAVVAFVTGLSGISRATYKETSFALLSHALFSETTDADRAVDRADAALESILALENLRGVEAAMSPEPAFRAGGQRAASTYRKTTLATNEDGTFVYVSPENSDYLTSRFITQDLLAGVINEQFDPTTLAGEIKDGDKDLQQDISGRAMPASYQAWCERRGVTPLDVSDRGEFDRYIGALSLRRYTAPGTVDANRRRLGRIIGVLRHGLTLMEEEHHRRGGDEYIAPGTEKEAARTRLETLLRDVWPVFLTPDRKTGESILGNAICDAIVLGPTTVGKSESGRVVAPESFLSALRIVKDWSLAEETEDGGLRLPAKGLALASKLTVDQADRLRGAFLEMLSDKGGDFTYRRGSTAEDRRNTDPEPIPLAYDVTSKVNDAGDAVKKETIDDTVSPADIAFLIELAVVSGRPFSSVTESDTRVDLTCIFDRKTLSDQECWGVAAERTMVGRALCCIGGSAESMYDIAKPPLEYPAFAVHTAVPLHGILASTEPGDKAGANAFRGRRYNSDDAWNQLAREPMTPVDILIDATMPGAEIEREHDALVKEHMSSRQSLVALGVLPALVDGKEQRFENRLVSSFDVKRGPDVLAGLNEAPKNAAGEYMFKFVGGEQYDDDGEPVGPSLHATLEDAVNSLGEGGAFVRGNGSFEQDVAEWVMRRKKGDMSFRELAKSVLRRTRERYGYAVDAWADRALDRGGRSAIDPATFGPVRAGVADYRAESAVRREGEQREYDKTNPLGDAFDSEFPLGPEMAAQREADSQVRPSVVIGFEESNIEKRMSRSGFAQFLQDADKDVQARVLKDPIKNIRRALEAVFGKSDGNGKVGVKVERVTESGKAGKVPTNLIRVTRWYKVEENGSVEVKSAVTYIATGEVLGMHPDNNAYLAGIARAVSNGDAAAEERTLALLKGIRPDQVAAFARAQGCSVAGESDTGLTTTKLLALTGLIRLGSGADYKTLFHEYFHQMLAFYRRIGVCTAKDMEELTSKFNIGGQFNEEAAADAFADYVVGKTDGPEPGKLLADGVGDDELFNRFLKTAQAFLAGATATDADGAPVFMKMLVTGDFSERSVRKAAEATSAELARVERMLLGQDVDLPAGLDWQGPRGITVIESDVTLAYAAFRDGRGGQKELFDALRAYMNGSVDAKEHPEFKPTDKPFAIDPEAAEEGKPLEPKKEKKSKKSKKGRKGKKLEPKKAKPEKSGCVRAAEMMRAALNGLESGVLAPDAQRAYDALKAGAVHDTAAASDCLVIAAELMHSLQYAYGLAEDDIVGDKDKILELAVRVAHMASQATPAEAGDKYACHKLLASQDALAKVLRGVAPSRQHGAVMASVESAASYLETVAGHIAAPESAEAVRRMAAEVRRTGAALASGKTPGLTFGTLLGFALDGAAFRQGPDGLVVELTPTKSSIHDADAMREIEPELKLAAHALGLAYAFGELLRENGKDHPAAGASPELGRNPARPPANGCLEPDVSPQMILQSQTSWLASDMMRKFFGVDLRDIMTDTSYQAAVERPNLDMRNLEFYYGADVQPGGRARAVSLGTTDLHVGEDGVMEANKKFRKTARKYAAVRGYALGLVNRAAKEAGDAWEWNDVDLVNLALQTAGYIANGEKHYITGIDLSNDTLTQLKDLFAKRLTRTPEGYDGSFDPRAVINRVHGKRKGEAVATERPLNLDQALYKVITCLNPAVTGVELDDKGRPTGKVAKDGLYDVIVDTYARVLGAVASRGVPAGFRVDVKVAEQLASRGYAMTVKSGARAGKSYLTIPVEKIEDAWDNSDTVKKLVNAGRTKSLLGLRRAAQEIATAAARLNRAASKSTFVREASGRVITGQGLAGMWFDSGSGGHGLSVRAFENARDFFDTPVSDADEDFLRNKFRAFALTAQSDAKKTWRSGIRSMVTGAVGGTTVRGLEPAFLTDGDGNLVHVQVNKIQHLMQLMGFGARASHNEILAFVEGVHEGIYARGSARNPSSVDLNGDMTVFQLDHAIYELECVELHRAALHEGDSVLTRPESEGGYGYSRQDLVDLNEWLRREGLRMMLDEDADRKVDNAVNTVSAATMLQEFGELPSSRTGPERVKAMAETLATSERFRGCLAQMLTTVGVDGSPNYVVSPGAGAENFAPDQYWGALARFVLAKMAVFHGNRGFGYDDTLSGVENMRRVAERVRAEAARDDNMKKKPGTRIPWRLVPPDDIQAGNLFGFVLAREDGPEGNEDKMNAFVGGEAMGYLKQLFGVVKSPTTWRGWATLDRIMAYSKAMSVGMSAFFAFATRFESPVAACGFLNTVAGYHKWSSHLARKLGERLRRDKDGNIKKDGVGAVVADFFNLEENMPYLKDFIEANTSDDPAIAHMREYMDLVGMPLSDAIRNPMSDTGGQIDSDIKRLSDWLIATGHKGLAKEVRGMMNAALHNPGEYAFSNVLNCVKMAVVAQTLHRLRRECERAQRPFDPVRELRRFSAYINAEIGGIQPERYAWLTPGMQQVLRLAMFSYQWTMGAWTAGTGGIVTDMIFGGHSTTKDARRFAFIRWLRMLGIVKVGVPVVMQLVIKGLAKALSGVFMDPDDPDGEDPLGIEDMPWLCFDNESKIGALSFDVTPLLRLCGKLRGKVDDATRSWVPKGVSSAVPIITGMVGGFLTHSVGGGLLTAAATRYAGSALPDYTGVGHGRNTSGQRRYYMHFGKQSDEFWRWFTDFWTQATNKLSVPTQKTIEAFWGSTNGSNFGKNFKDKPILDRFFTTNLDPQDNALVNWFTSFMSFSAASVAANPDAGVLGMFAPIQMGASMTGQQKRIAERLEKFALDERFDDPWADPRNRKDLRLLAADILRECRLNGFQPEEVLKSGLGTATGNLYKRLYSALPKTKDDKVDGAVLTETLRAMRRLQVKKQSVDASLKKKFKAANVDLESPRYAHVAAAIKNLFKDTGRDPWMDDAELEAAMQRVFDEAAGKKLRSTDVQQDRKGGEAFSNFLATDEVPETLFGIPVVSSGYTPDDLEFFRRNPKAAGYYDLGDGGEEPPPEEPPPEEPPPDGSSVHGLSLGGVPMFGAIIGPKGAEQYKKTTGRNLGDLEKAKAMKQGWFESDAAFKKRMIAETGWQQDGGRWKYETRTDPKLRPDVRQLLSRGRMTVSLPDVLDYSGTPELLAAYPQLKAAKTVLAGQAGDAVGDALRAKGATGLVTRSGVIVANPYPRGRLDMDTLEKTLLHEPTHVTDEIEMGPQVDAGGKYRRLPGMTADEAYRRAETEVNARNVERRARMTPEQRRSIPLSETADVEESKRIVRQDGKGGKAKRKIPPIVKGPLHYGPPPPPPRGPYPGIANNPGNVEKHERRADKTLFRGEIEGGVRPKRFANFSDPVDGLTAAATVLSRRAAGLAAKGLPFTIENYVPGYAPKSENDTEGYINNLSKYSGFARDAALDTGNAEDMAKLLKNVVRFESGVPNSEWFTDDEYRRAALAMQEGASD